MMKLKNKEKSQQFSIFTWVKDSKFRFTSCSENLCELAGEDSPYGMIYKNDFQLIWRNEAEFFREKDIQIFQGKTQYTNVVETIDVINNGIEEKQKILITKSQIFNKNGKCIGIAGSHINLPSDPIENTYSKKFDEKGRLWLPDTIGNEYLTKKEAIILKKILLGKTSKQIAKLLNLSHRTVEEYTNKIKKKLQCTYKNEIHKIVVEHGITHLL